VPLLAQAGGEYNNGIVMRTSTVLLPSSDVNGDAIPGFPILVKASGKDSNIIKAPSGIAPFDRATNPSDPFPRMPAPRGPYLDPEMRGQISSARANKAIDPPALITSVAPAARRWATSAAAILLPYRRHRTLGLANTGL
jgi:hypothetical protein